MQKKLILTFYLVAIGMVYGLIYVIFPYFLSGPLDFYIAQSLTWLSLAALSYLTWRFILVTKPGLKRGILFLAAGLGLSQVSVLLLTGMVFGFGSSPFDHSLVGLLRNAIYLASMLLGMEITRATLLAWLHRRQMLAIILVSLLMLILQEPFYKFLSFSNGPAVVQFMGEEILPSFMVNVLTSMLALLGGPIPAILYRGILLIFEWGSPILPKYNWAITALVGTLVPALGLIYTQNNYFAGESSEQTKSSSTQTRTLPWILVLTVAVVAIWFNMGVFGVRPFIISGHSMKPEFDVGDMVIIKPVKPEEIQIGDIIRYDRENISIVHRVIQIQNSNNGLVFITKGDNNNVEDPPVEQSTIKGRIVGIMPGIGWLSIGIRQVFGWAH
jgi:signal peptidase I